MIMNFVEEMKLVDLEQEMEVIELIGLAINNEEFAKECNIENEIFKIEFIVRQREFINRVGNTRITNIDDIPVYDLMVKELKYIILNKVYKARKEVV